MSEDARAQAHEKFLYIYEDQLRVEVVWVTCYFKHLRDVFKKAGIVITKDTKREVDRVVHAIVNVEYKDCSATWREIKKRIAENEEGFVSKLREAWDKHL